MIEKKTSNTFLQKKEEIEINGKTYYVEPPSAATLVLVSEQLAVLPKDKLNEDFVFGNAMANAKHINEIARSLAIMILGARKIENKKTWFGESKLEKLTKEIKYLEIKKLSAKYLEIMKLMQVQDFFALITFLREINLTKPTKEVIETTASGR